MPNVVRKNFSSLTAAEKTRYVRAVLAMKNLPPVPITAAPDNYQKFVDWHNTGAINDLAHATISFLAWHRVFLYLFEKDIRMLDIALGNDGNIAIPYWDWTVDRSANPDDVTGKLWDYTRTNASGATVGTDFMGGSGIAGTNEVTTGPFVNRATSPGGSIAWHVTSPNEPGGFLRRNLGPKTSSSGAVTDLATPDDVNYALSQPNFDEGNFLRSIVPGEPADSPNNPVSFRNVLEGWKRRYSTPPTPAVPNPPRLRSVSCHNSAHVWVGGSMEPNTSPNDPVFFIHHSNVDRLWAKWQLRHPQLAAQYPSDTEVAAANARIAAVSPPIRGRSAGGAIVIKRLNDELEPWTTGSGNGVWTTRSVLNYRTMTDGDHTYSYDDDTSALTLTP